MGPEPTRYLLATGAKEVERLRLLEAAYGPQSQALLRRAGLREGMRVVEVGCGSGNVTCWLAAQVGAAGSAVGVDDSPAQVEQAHHQADARGLPNVQFVVADAAGPGLPPASFDLAYCRLVLVHVHRPAPALVSRVRLVFSPNDTSRHQCNPFSTSQWPRM